MKLIFVAISSLLALAAAQESSSTSSGAPAATASLTPAQRCILQCDDTDRCCRAQCVGVPCPSDQQANDTNTCVAACDQGSGSESDTEAYAQCQARCYTTHFFPATATVSSGSSSSGTHSSATTTGSSSDNNSDNSSSGSQTSSNSPNSTSSGNRPEDTNAAAVTQLKLSASAAGLVGFLLAAWAL